MTYIGVSPSNGVRRVHTYTATGSQTSFTGASSEGITLSYTDANFMDVYQNGVLLAPADYTATSGTSVVLAEGAAASDIVTITVYDAFSVADTVSKSAGGTFDGNVAMAGTLGVTGVVTANAGVVVDNITIDGTQIDLSSGDLTLDVAGDIILDAGGAEVKFADDGTQYGTISNSSTNLVIKSDVSDKDIIFQGNDGGSVITALTLDMSDNGRLKTNSRVNINGASDRGILTVAANTSAMTTNTNHQIVLENTDQTSDAKGIINYKTNADSGASFTPVAFGGITVNPANATRTGAFCVYVADTDNVALGSDERMRITSGGNVGIGTASPNISSVGKALTINTTSSVILELAKNGSRVANFFSDGTNASLTNNTNNALTFLTNNAERMRIHSGGQVSIATTDATHGFNVGQSGTDYRGRFQGSNQYRLGLQNGTNNLVWLGSGGADNFRVSNAGGSTRFEIEANGYMKVSQQARIMFQGNSNGNTNVANGETFGSTNDGNPAFSTGKSFVQAVGITYDSATGRFTVPVAGRYIIHFQAYYNAGAASCRIGTYINAGQVNLAHNSSIVGTLHVSFVANMGANDYIEFRQNSGGTQAWYMGENHMLGYIVLIN